MHDPRALASRLLRAAKQILAADTYQHRQWDRFTEEQVKGMGLNEAIHWLEWNDPNGDYRDQEAKEVNGPSGDTPAEPSDAMTREEATDLLWEQVLSSREGPSEKLSTNGVSEENEIPLKDRTSSAWWSWYYSAGSVDFGNSTAGKAQAAEECEAWLSGDPEAAGPHYHLASSGRFAARALLVRIDGAADMFTYKGQGPTGAYVYSTSEHGVHAFNFQPKPGHVFQANGHSYELADDASMAQQEELKRQRKFRQMDEDRALRTRDLADQTGLTSQPRKQRR